ncbi:MAG: hypothetical protein JWQ80_182 [Massilia sp.]|nr:hypothetical protein [Massilia sp.]
MPNLIITRRAAGLLGTLAMDLACASVLAAPPPSADLQYKIVARQKGISLTGEALVNWRAGDGKYSVVTESRAQILGKILENRSEGALDDEGLVPAVFTEKRFRKDQTVATFDRAGKSLSFNSGGKTYVLSGGEQDRASAQWQLATLARTQPDKFTPGSEWRFLVAGRKDAEPWVFRVVKREKITTGLGKVDTVHLSKAPPADSRAQHVDLWLAPGREWYPVQIRFSDEDGEFVEQTIDRISKK